METNSTDEEKAPGRPMTGRAERRESPPREYVGVLCDANLVTVMVMMMMLCNQHVFIFFFQMRKEYVMYQSGLGHLLLFCGTTGTPGKLPTTTSRGTATSGSKVSGFLSLNFMQRSSDCEVRFLLTTIVCLPLRGEEGQLTGYGQPEGSGMQSTGLEAPPVRRTAQAAGEAV